MIAASFIFALLTAAPPQAGAADAFFANLTALCGKRFAGKRISTDPQDADFDGKPMTMHVRDCNTTEIRIPFAVGSDRSRTWIVTRTSTGLRLKHDHRHEDGSEDAMSLYGGDTRAPGSATRQEFPVDAYSIALFERLDRKASTTNIWALEVHPGHVFQYELRRANRDFRVSFDLTKPIG